MEKQWHFSEMIIFSKRHIYSEKTIFAKKNILSKRIIYLQRSCSGKNDRRNIQLAKTCMQDAIRHCTDFEERNNLDTTTSGSKFECGSRATKEQQQNQ